MGVVGRPQNSQPLPFPPFSSGRRRSVCDGQAWAFSYERDPLGHQTDKQQWAGLSVNNKGKITDGAQIERKIAARSAASSQPGRNGVLATAVNVLWGVDRDSAVFIHRRKNSPIFSCISPPPRGDDDGGGGPLLAHVPTSQCTYTHALSAKDRYFIRP